MEANQDLLDPTPDQIKNRACLWADALKDNRRKARKAMYDSHGGRCCLAVAQDVAVSCGVNLKNPDSGLPDENVKKFFGWGSTNPTLTLKINGRPVEAPAAKINDIGIPHLTTNKRIKQYGFSHKEIAQFVLDTFVRN